MSREEYLEKFGSACDSHLIYNVCHGFVNRMFEDNKMIDRFFWDLEAQLRERARIIAGVDPEGEYDDDIYILQWWTVSVEFAHYAAKFHEVILEMPFGFVWGRQGDVLNLEQDSILHKIFGEMKLI